MKRKGSLSLLSIVIDEMSIQECVEFKDEQFYGYVNLGDLFCHYDTEQPDKTKNALVFMAVSVNNFWKIPLGYFLIKSLNTTQLASLVTTCLTLLHDVCHSITFDGAYINISMCNKLGASYNVGEDFKSYFLHPLTKSNFWDPAHMFKLCRNALGGREVFYDKEKQPIKWDLINPLLL